MELLFSVADTGAGIATVKLKAIFDEFTQAETSTTRRYGGTGLGLTISRQLVELMGGALGVHSQIGSGSTFHFAARFEFAPAAATDSAQVDEQAEAPAHLSLRGAKVLLADDNEVNQLVACEMLRAAGVEVLVADNGRQALDLLNANPDVDVVLMDCYKPVMDGFAATRAIRSNRKFRQLPVVALTANVLPDDLINCRVAGMNDHVGKPFRSSEICGVLARWVNHNRLVERLADSGIIALDG